MESELLKNLAKNVRSHRQRRELSQEMLADICGLHRTYIGGIERSERNITLNTLDRLAQALEVNPIDLLRGARHGKE